MERAKKIVVWIAVLLVMTAIYMFSAQHAEASDNLSEGLLSQILERIVSNYSSLDEAGKLALIEKYNKYLRKFAHYFIFTLLGFVLSWLLNLYKIQENRSRRIALLTGFLYAAADEFHQLFISGRCGRITDVIIDSSGVLTGILGFILLEKVYKKLKRNN